MIDDCILVTGAEDISYVKEEIVAKYGFSKVAAVVAGGKERYDSVYNGLQAAAGSSGQGGEKPGASDEDGYIFIQDGARPFLTEDILERCYEAVAQDHACVAGMPVKDTIKIVDESGFARQTPDRNFMWQVQTPQVFDAALIIFAYKKLMQEKERLLREGISITDDAMVVKPLRTARSGWWRGITQISRSPHRRIWRWRRRFWTAGRVSGVVSIIKR